LAAAALRARATASVTTATAATTTAAGSTHSDGHAAQYDRLGLLIGRRLEAWHAGARNLALDQLFDVAQEDLLVTAHQAQGLALRAGTARATDAVHIVLGHIGQFEIHHVGQLIDVDAAGGNVGGHQHRQGAGLEFAQCLGARALAFVAVDGHGRDPLFAEVLGQTIGAVLHACEHQDLVPIAFSD
jgi:hypothetical protein